MSNLVHVYKKVKPAIVALGISVQAGSEVELVIAGTGFCVHPRGIIVTCRHVFEAFQDLSPGFKDRLNDMLARPGEIIKSFEALPIYAMFFFEENGRWVMVSVAIGDVVSDTEIDISVLRASAIQFRTSGEPYPVIQMGDSNALKEGQELAASGFPFGYRLHKLAGSANASLTTGVVSAILPAPPAITAGPKAFKSFQLGM